MDTIIFIVLLVGAIFAAKGSKATIVIPIYVVGFVLSAILFNHHVTSSLGLSF